MRVQQTALPRLLRHVNRGTVPEPGEEPPDSPCERNSFLNSTTSASGFDPAP